MLLQYGHFLLCLLCFIPVQSDDQIFYGGSISYRLEEIAGKKIVSPFINAYASSVIKKNIGAG